MTPAQEFQLLESLGLTATSCARCGHEHSWHSRLSEYPHSGHSIPCQERLCLCPQFIPLRYASYVLQQVFIMWRNTHDTL